MDLKQWWPKAQSYDAMRRTLTLRWQIMLILSVILVLTLVVAETSISIFLSRNERQEWQERQGDAARAANETIHNFLQRTHDSLALIGVLDRSYLASTPKVMPELLARNPELLEIIRADADGTVFTSASQDTPVLANLFTIVQSSWFRTAIAGQTYLGDLQLSSNNEPYLIIAQPTPDRGVVAARLRMTVLWDLVRTIHFGETGQVYVVSQTGRVIAHRDTAVALTNTSLAGRPELLLAQPSSSEGGARDYVNFQGEPVLGMMTTLTGTEWLMVTELSQTEASEITRNVVFAFGGGMLLFGIIVMGVISLLLGRLAFRPIERLRAGAVQIARGDVSGRIAISRADEIGQLAAAFNTMAAAVEERERALQGLAASLEQQVEERTAELRREGEERARLQEETVRQAAALLELSTPLIPISDQVLAMPLIGALDTRRMQQVIGTLLRGLESSRVRSVILDITGVPVVDTQVCRALLHAAEAVRLLGGRVVLTGIRPEVAQALVSLGVDLGAIVTRGTLQNGIEFALRHGSEVGQ